VEAGRGICIYRIGHRLSDIVIVLELISRDTSCDVGKSVLEVESP
jgi:hypothetical protein